MSCWSPGQADGSHCCSVHVHTCPSDVQSVDTADQSMGATVVSNPRSVECHSTLPLSRLVIFLFWARALFLASIADQAPWWSDHEESPWHPLAFM